MTGCIMFWWNGECHAYKKNKNKTTNNWIHCACVRVVRGHWRHDKYKSMGNIEKKTLKRNDRVVAYSQSQLMNVLDEY